MTKMRGIYICAIILTTLAVSQASAVKRNIVGQTAVSHASAVDISVRGDHSEASLGSKLSGIWFSWVYYGLKDEPRTYVGVLSAWDVSTGLQHLSEPIVNASGSGWAAIDVKGGRYFQIITPRDAPNSYKQYELLTYSYKTGSSTRIPVSRCAFQNVPAFNDNVYSAALGKIVLKSSAEFARYVNGVAFYLLDPNTCDVTKVPMAPTDVSTDKCATDQGNNVWCIGRRWRTGVFFSVDLVTGKNQTYTLPMDDTLPGSWTLMRYFSTTNSIYYATTTSYRVDALWRFDLPQNDRQFSYTKVNTGKGRVSSQWFDVNTQHNLLLTNSGGSLSGFDILTGNMTYNLASWTNGCAGSPSGSCTSIGPAYDEFYSWNQ